MGTELELLKECNKILDRQLILQTQLTEHLVKFYTDWLD